MIKMEELMKIFEAKERLRDLRAEFRSDYGRSYRVIKEELDKVAEEYTAILKETISDFEG